MNTEHINKAHQFKTLSGTVADHYEKWHESVLTEDDTFDQKTIELMALTAAVAVHCSYCIEAHSQKARSQGASEEEIAKAVQIASVIGAGSAIAYGVEALQE